jgi:Ca2+/Na+ antiporter
MNKGTLIYRVVYAAHLTIVLAVLAKQIYFGVQADVPETIPLALYAGAVTFVLIAIATFRRIPPPLVWLATLCLYGLFVWYSWYSLDAPFRLREFHTFDPAGVAREKQTHYLIAVPVFGLLSLWLLSLPIVKQIIDRRSRTDV